MALLLIPVSFILLILLLSKKDNILISKIIIESILALSAIIWVGTEITSAANAFGFTGIFIFWSIVTCCLIIAVIRFEKHKNTARVVVALWQQIRRHKVLSIAFSLLFVTLFIQGTIFPPNNFDSLAYHMSRIAHWVSNGNVDHYPTSIYRQIFQPPFSEWFIGHVCILYKSDLFANFIQLFYLIGILFCVVEICRELGYGKQVKYIAIIFIATTPMILLEASSTQNDIVVSFFVLLSSFYAIKAIKSRGTGPVALMSLSAGFACLTKGTGYIFVFPALLCWFLVWAYMNYKNLGFKNIAAVLMFPVIFGLTNIGYFWRNTNLSNHLFGGFKEGVFNERIDAGTLASNLIRNSALHCGVYPLNILVQTSVIRLHDLFGADVNDPATTWINYGSEEKNKFELTKWMHHEDAASNIFQFFLILVAGLIATIKVRQDKNHLLYFFCFSSFLFFCMLLKWQPWSSKLHTTYFILFSIPVGYSFKDFTGNILFRLFWLLAAAFAILAVVFNPSRPFMTLTAQTPDVKLSDERYLKYFTNHLGYYDDVKSIKDITGTFSGRNIGFYAEERHETWEYPFYVGIFSDNRLKTFYQMKIDNPSKNAVKENEPAQFEYVIGYINSDSLFYHNSTYFRKTDNRYINLYVPVL